MQSQSQCQQMLQKGRLDDYWYKYSRETQAQRHFQKHRTFAHRYQTNHHLDFGSAMPPQNHYLKQLQKIFSAEG